MNISTYPLIFKQSSSCLLYVITGNALFQYTESVVFLDTKRCSVHSKLSAVKHVGSGNCGRQLSFPCYIENNGFNSRSRSDSWKPELIPGQYSVETSG